MKIRKLTKSILSATLAATMLFGSAFCDTTVTDTDEHYATASVALSHGGEAEATFGLPALITLEKGSLSLNINGDYEDIDCMYADPLVAVNSGAVLPNKVVAYAMLQPGPSEVGSDQVKNDFYLYSDQDLNDDGECDSVRASLYGWDFDDGGNLKYMVPIALTLDTNNTTYSEFSMPSTWVYSDGLNNTRMSLTGSEVSDENKSFLNLGTLVCVTSDSDAAGTYIGAFQIRYGISYLGNLPYGAGEQWLSWHS